MTADLDALTAAAYRSRLDWRDPEARLIWGDIARAAGMGTAEPSPDALELARREGKRALFLYLAGKVGLPVIPEV